MNLDELQTAQTIYESKKDNVISKKKELYEKRDSFIQYFNETRIREMTIDDYVLGLKHTDKGKRPNFCYGIEQQLDGLGRILGSTADKKFGIYYSKKDKEYKYLKKFGNSPEEAFQNIKNAILQLLYSDKHEKLEAIEKNPLSNMFKGKILSIYYPEEYLNIFSDDHLNYFLIKLDLDTHGILKSNPLYKRNALIEFKNQDHIMKKWTVDLFTHFLYTVYPQGPPNVKKEKLQIDLLKDYQPIIFPPNPKPEIIEMDILPVIQISEKGKRKLNGNINYEKESRKNKELGDRGEKIVLELEKVRLKNQGQKDSAEKVKRVAIKDDSLGYDILSYENDGVTERYIEVKATQANVGNANFFLTENELNKAKEIENYYVYMVYEVKTNSPKIWQIKNPFNPPSNYTQMTPIMFKVTINAKILK